MTPPKKWKKSECPICKGTGLKWLGFPFHYVDCDHRDRRKGERRKSG